MDLVHFHFLLISVYAFADYGVALFLGTPILVGAVSAFLYNRPYPRDFGSSLMVAQAAILVSGMAVLLFAFEGVICLMMLNRISKSPDPFDPSILVSGMAVLLFAFEGIICLMMLNRISKSPDPFDPSDDVESHFKES